MAGCTGTLRPRHGQPVNPRGGVTTFISPSSDDRARLKKMQTTHNLPTQMFGPTGLCDKDGEPINFGDLVLPDEGRPFIVDSVLGLRLYGEDADCNPITRLARFVERIDA